MRNQELDKFYKMTYLLSMPISLGNTISGDWITPEDQYSYKVPR